MKRGRFSEEQIVGILQEQEAGARTVDSGRNSHKDRPKSFAGALSRHSGTLG